MIEFDTDRYSLMDLVTGEKVEDEKARALMAYWQLEEKERNIKEAKDILVEMILDKR